jgi:GTPase SAR1 family protein
MHVLIVGTTGSGKTTIATRLASKDYNEGRLVFVLDPHADSRWNNCADIVTRDFEEFMKLAHENVNCTLIVDEAGRFCGNHDKESHWLATESRHNNHTAIFIGQRANMIATNIRGNCNTIFCFQTRIRDAEVYADDFCCDALEDAANLRKGECIYFKRFGEPKKINVFSA